jgi:ABC-2 type transport system ATP-binding protein
MRAIVGVQKIHSGTLEVLGMSAGSAELRSKIGYVTQIPAIYGDLTVTQNLRYFAAVTRATDARVDEVIVRVDLESQRHQIAESLSGGQKTRVSLAVALLAEPELLVLDEPTVGLDPILRQELWQLFGELAAQGKTLLISSHAMDDAQKCASIMLLRDGALLWHDSREALLEATNTHSVGDAFIEMIKSKGTA